MNNNEMSNIQSQLEQEDSVDIKNNQIVTSGIVVIPKD